MANSLNIPTYLYIYNEGVKGIDLKELTNFIKNNFGNIPVKLIKLKERIVQTKGLLFDPLGTAPIFLKRRVDKNGRCPYFNCHIILTDKLFATFDEEKKLHIRASIYGFPSIISISGVVEGPAKPRDYYIYKDRYLKLGTWALEEPKVKRLFKGRFIDYGDKRLTDVLKGYISQALFFHIIGEPFCAKRGCRLFNAHWQEDLTYSQIKVGKFCPVHKRFLEEVKKSQKREL